VLEPLVERVAHAGADPHRGVLGGAELGCDLIGGLEVDGADVAREAVRVLADDRHGFGAVGLVDPHRPRGADAVGVQEQHDLAHGVLLGQPAAMRCARTGPMPSTSRSGTGRPR